MRGAVAMLLACVAGSVAAQDFSDGSEAKEMGLSGEAKARFEAQVVDVLCTLAGDCPAECGGGDRQLGLVRTADDRLILASKNAQFSFNGAVEDLLPYCGQTVEVDGLMIGDPEAGTAQVFMLQRIRTPDADWAPANRWTDAWAAANPDAAGPGPWFRRAPRVNALIEENGYLGLGPEADAAFIEEWFE